MLSTPTPRTTAVNSYPSPTYDSPTRGQHCQKQPLPAQKLAEIIQRDGQSLGRSMPIERPNTTDVLSSTSGKRVLPI